MSENEDNESTDDEDFLELSKSRQKKVLDFIEAASEGRPQRVCLQSAILWMD
jgi:hypothetical protein